MAIAPPALILASASPRRQALLEQIGITPTAIIAADIDETPHRHELPHLYALRMAHEKALKISKEDAQALVLAADTVVAMGRRILPKAETQPQALDCLKQLSGRRHKVLTAFALFKNGQKCAAGCVSSMVQFKRLTCCDIDWYLQSGQWQGKAGGYAIQGCAQALIKQMSGSYSAIVGLPLHEVRNALAAAGISA